MIRKQTARFGVAVLGLAAAFCFTTQANAKGCNGVVNQLEWGCAAWDNNNGPQYPHYKGPAKAAAPAKPAASVPPPAVAAGAQRPVVGPNGGSGIVASGAGNIVASGAGNAVPKNGNGIVASGAGNLQHK